MVQIHVLRQGSRVRIRRGESFPIDPSLVGREGTVVHLRRGEGRRYDVQLDDEAEIRVFAADELEPTRPAGSLAEAGAHQGGSGSDISS